MNSPRPYEVVAVDSSFCSAWRSSSSTCGGGPGNGWRLRACCRSSSSAVVDGPLFRSDRLLRLDGLRPRRALSRSPNARLGHRGNGAAVRRAAFLDAGIRSWRALRSKSGLAATGSSGPTSSPCRPCSGSSGTSAGGTRPNLRSLSNAAKLPSYVLDGVSNSLASWLGLNTTAVAGVDTEALESVRPLLLLAAAIVAVRWYRLGRPHQPNAGDSRRDARVLVRHGSQRIDRWSTDRDALRLHRGGPSGSVRVRGGQGRPGSGLARRRGRGGECGRSGELHLAARCRPQPGHDRAAGAGRAGRLELARDRVDPALALDPENSDVDYLGRLLDAGSYLSAVDAYGSPAYTPAESRGPEVARVAADKVSGAALRIRLAPGTIAGAQRCLKINAASGPTARVPAGGGIRRWRAKSRRRFAAMRGPRSLSLGTLRGAGSAPSNPTDRSTVPWVVQLTGSGVAQVCSAGA